MPIAPENIRKTLKATPWRKDDVSRTTQSKHQIASELFGFNSNLFGDFIETIGLANT